MVIEEIGQAWNHDYIFLTEDPPAEPGPKTGCSNRHYSAHPTIAVGDVPAERQEVGRVNTTLLCLIQTSVPLSVQPTSAQTHFAFETFTFPLFFLTIRKFGRNVNCFVCCLPMTAEIYL